MEPSEKPAGTKSKQHNWIPTLLCWQFFPHILGILVVLLLAAAPIPICELGKVLGRRRERPESREVPPGHGTGRPVSGAGAAK